MSFAANSPLSASRMALLAAGLVIAMASGFVQAATLTVQVSDAAGLPVPDAVIYAELAGGGAPAKPPKPSEIEQKARKFAPLVTVIQVGTEVSFPNNDTVRHHVYSFSTPKVFELKLYSGTPGSPILFDKPGTIVVGCNIHDQMMAYIHVVNTPWFGRTDATGKMHIDGLPAGKYSLKFWHYKTPATNQIQEQPLVMTAADANAAFKVGARSTTAAAVATAN
jgi:plastocyanin